MDIKDLTWEQKALIGIGALTVIILLIAFNPFKSTDSSVENRIDNSPLSFQSTPQASPFNNNTNNTGTENTTNNTNLNITSDKAKEIAREEGYTIGQPTKGSIVINNETISVWIVPLSKDFKVAKEVYVDIATGSIVATRETSENQASSNSTQL
ncbi:hypothetical protein [Methanobacterium alcaliphilum]|uniref:hypothetical protein n=1 Tax=Methanobacterium alcaliphilum TaxID=392018 RepID=UPI00200A35C2|nr:hypothetical protein [Methanobacterium alcaliphilum]MCK9150651.1 hypothetical protein [Methanobacterium alcaliphilum]